MLKLAMNFLIKNEIDIIEDNIKFHSAMGVDCFVVFDNGSTDGTRELIESLKYQYEIAVFDKPSDDYQQSNWKTEMAFLSKKLFGANWSIANDADEFWVPDYGGLKDDLSRFGSVIECPRYNMQLTEEFFSKNYCYYDSNFQVNLSIDNKAADIINDPNISIMLGKINGKIIVNNLGLLRVKGGNHRAWHLFSNLNKKGSSRIKVYHYPIRSEAHFYQHLENRKQLLSAGVTKMGDHYRRWVKMYEKGEIEHEINRLVLDKKTISVLKKYGVLKENNHPGYMIRRIIGD